MDYNKLTEDGINAFVKEFTTGSIEVTTVTNLYMGGYKKGYADGVRDCQKAGAMNETTLSDILIYTGLCLLMGAAFGVLGCEIFI